MKTSLSGIETHGQFVRSPDGEVEKTLNPFQGLKLSWFALAIGELTLKKPLIPFRD